MDWWLIVIVIVFGLIFVDVGKDFFVKVGSCFFCLILIVSLKLVEFVG